MAYCDISDVRSRCSSVTVSDVSDSEVATYILMAQDEIDSALATEYAVPFDPVPHKIRWMCSEIAAYFLMRDYPDKIFAEDKAEIRKDFKEAVDALKNGDIELVGVIRSPYSTSGPYFTTVSSSPAKRWTSNRGGYDEI